jgi:hypothetical protein
MIKPRTAIWTVLVLIIFWFMALAYNQFMFYRTDVLSGAYGYIRANQTDIGIQCGKDFSQSNPEVEFKLSAQGELIYLCPTMFWPIQQQVRAQKIPDQLKRFFPASQ